MNHLHLHHDDDDVPGVDEEPSVSDEVTELRDQRRALRKVCDEQRHELIRKDREIAELRRTLAHERSPKKRRRRWLK